MANTSRPQMVEGQSTNRPPLFNSSDYSYWKTRMTTYIKGQDYLIWKIIVNGPHVPTKIVEEQEIPKQETEWDENDVKLIELNYKAMNCLYCAFDSKEFDEISSCNSAKEIWERLEATYEEASQESKMSMLVHDHKLPQIEKDECTSISPQTSNDEEDSTEAFCLMAYEDEVTSKLNSLEDESYSYDELQNAFEELVEEFEKNVLKNKVFKKKVTSLSNELDDFKSKNEILEKQIISLNDKNLSLEKEIIKLKIESQSFIEKMKAKDVETSSQIAYDSNLLVNENKELKLKVENLNKILTNFTNGKKNLDNLLGSQRCVFDKAGIGYNPKIKEKHYQKFFINENFLKSPICKHCGKLGHNIHTCPMKNMIWVVKGTTPPKANPSGPKKIWVPKKVI
jgi:gag-polypeptide of LTR copia-type